MCLSVCLRVCLFVCMPVCLRLSLCLSASQFVCLHACLFVCLSARLSACLFVCVCLGVCLCVSVSLCLPGRVFANLPACLSVCLSTYPSLSVCQKLVRKVYTWILMRCIPNIVLGQRANPLTLINYLDLHPEIQESANPGTQESGNCLNKLPLGSTTETHMSLCLQRSGRM